MVTNGDNDYASTFFSRIAGVQGPVDLIAFDFYSRYHRATGVADAGHSCAACLQLTRIWMRFVSLPRRQLEPRP